MQTIVVSLRNLISETSIKLQQQIETSISQNKKLQTEMSEWVQWQGLGRKGAQLRLVSRQATYNLILKLMLYEMLRDQFSLPTVFAHSLENLEELFELARQRTGLDAFTKSFLDRIMEGCDGQLSANLSDTAGLVDKVEENGTDFIGRVYEDIIPGEERRKLGEFYTPRDISEFMTRWAITSKTDRVLDPAAGSGTFLIDALYRLVELHCSPGEAIEHLHGVDINPLAVLMSTVNLVARVPDSKPHLSVSDFLTTAPWGEQKFQAIVCNPPYSRHHELSQKYKELIAKKIDAECGEKISRLSGIYVHFFIHATTFLDDRGRMAFITPSEFLDVDYGIELKKFILENLTLKAVILYPEDSLVFPEALTTACITLIEKRKPSPEHKVVFVRLDRPPEPRELSKAVENTQNGSFHLGLVELIPQSQLTAKDKWSYLTTSPKDITGLIPFRNIARTHRGIATGANEFFTLSEGEAQLYGIEPEFLKQIITNARSIPYYNFTKRDFQKLAQLGNKVWLLDCDRQKEALKEHKNLLKYLASGEEKGLHNRYLTRTRNVWYFQEKREIAPIVFTYMSRENPRFVYNEAGALTLNTLHSIYPLDRIAKDKGKLKSLLCYLNSSICRAQLKKTGRVYGGGLIKLEPREVENLPIIDLDKLSREEISLLEGLFDELCVSAREGRENDARKKIDQVLEKIIKR